MADQVRTMGDKLRDAVNAIREEHPEIACLFAAPPIEETGGHVYCKIYVADEQGKPIGEPVKVVQIV